MIERVCAGVPAMSGAALRGWLLTRFERVRELCKKYRRVRLALFVNTACVGIRERESARMGVSDREESEQEREEPLCPICEGMNRRDDR
jgi:hypothetical protein